jgi:hypothetical protein
MSRPTIHLTNASSRNLHQGRLFNIMAAPRRWERFAGNVAALTPAVEWLRAVQLGTTAPSEYRAACEDRFEASLARGCLTLGGLRCPSMLVADGDTLVCACSKAAAAEGKCHRVWAAPFLVRAGWRVVLDGVEAPA